MVNSALLSPKAIAARKASMLDDPSKGVAVQGGNWIFRTFEIDK